VVDDGGDDGIIIEVFMVIERFGMVSEGGDFQWWGSPLLGGRKN
jgi:hypothetical protein